MESRMKVEIAKCGLSTMLHKAEGVHGGQGGWWEGGGGGGRRLVEFRQVRSAHVWRDTATTKQVQTMGHISGSCRIPDHNPVRRLRRIDHTPSHLDYYRLGVWLLLRLSVPSLPCLRGAQLSTTTLSRPLATISSGSVPIANRHLLAAVLIRCSSQQA